MLTFPGAAAGSDAVDADTSASATGPELQEGADRWIASAGIVGGFLFQKQNGRVRSFDSMGNDVRRTDDGEETTAAPYVGLNLQLMSPTLPLPGQPRLFVAGEFLPTFGPNRNLAQEGNPGRLEPPLNEGSTGQGSRTRSEPKLFTYGFRAGVAFPFEYAERQLRIKPFFSYLSYELDVTGIVRNVYSEPGLGARVVNLKNDDQKRFHGIGPGIELEMDVGRFGPFGAVLAIEAHGIAVLGDRTIRVSDSETISDSLDPVLGVETYTARWKYRGEPWLYRAGVGIRFQWLGETFD